MVRAAHQMLDAEDLDALVAGLRAFVRAEVVARHESGPVDLSDPWQVYGPDGRYRSEVLDLMAEVRQASARAGYYTMVVPEQLGGAGLGFEALYRAWEAIYHECGPRYWLGYQALAHWARGPGPVLVGASASVRQAVLAGLLTGARTLCFCMSEPDAGSDAWMMRTRAEPSESGWRLTGTKQWITNGPYADYAVVFAITDPEAATARRGGVTGFIVPTDAPGFRVDSILRLFGHGGGDEAIVSLSEVEVGPEAVLGEVGSGFRLALSGAATGRLYNSARSVGLARWALERAVDYAQDRVAFGRPILDNQGVSFPLADASTDLWAARLMGIECARRLDRGEPGRTELAMTKAFSTEMAVRVVDRAMQVHGAMGFTNETGLAEAWQQVRRICVADGPSEIMRRQIARALASGALVL
jgi:acyl-CoA dehydrogenase